MKQIWKYPLEDTLEQIILMPEGSKILYIGEQRRVICVWAEVYLEAPMEHRKFYLIGTGHPMPLEPTYLKYLGTVVMSVGMLVWHVYEAKKGMLQLKQPYAGTDMSGTDMSGTETDEDKEKRRRGL